MRRIRSVSVPFPYPFYPYPYPFRIRSTSVFVFAWTYEFNDFDPIFDFPDLSDFPYFVYLDELCLSFVSLVLALRVFVVSFDGLGFPLRHHRAPIRYKPRLVKRGL